MNDGGKVLLHSMKEFAANTMDMDILPLCVFVAADKDAADDAEFLLQALLSIDFGMRNLPTSKMVIEVQMEQWEILLEVILALVRLDLMNRILSRFPLQQMYPLRCSVRSYRMRTAIELNLTTHSIQFDLLSFHFHFQVERLPTPFGETVS